MTTEIKAETSKVLMSDVLRGRVPEDLEDEAVATAADTLQGSVISVIANVQVGRGVTTPVCGILRSVLFENEPELEFRLTLDDALAMVSTEGLQFLGFELHYGDKQIKSPGPYTIKGARIDDIDAANGLCVLSLGLKRPPKA
jgi:hypothetical protein